MADAVVTNIAREKMLKARAGDITLPKIVGIAFGSGGISDGEVVVPIASQTALKRELLRKPVTSHTFVDTTTCRYSCTLSADELAGQSISEIALYDEDGDLLAIKNFTAKGKDSDIEMTFNVDDAF